jgi:hypothetical protein
VAEGARLESVYTVSPYRGFESLSLRQFLFLEKVALEFLSLRKHFQTPVFIGFSAFQSLGTCVPRESQNHQKYPKISYFTLRFSDTCERRS